MTDDERQRVRAWLEAEMGQDPELDALGLVGRCLRALGLPPVAGAETLTELDALLNADAAEEDAFRVRLGQFRPRRARPVTARPRRDPAVL